jgi:hypothetical protein
MNHYCWKQKLNIWTQKTTYMRIFWKAFSRRKFG